VSAIRSVSSASAAAAAVAASPHRVRDVVISSRTGWSSSSRNAAAGSTDAGGSDGATDGAAEAEGATDGATDGAATLGAAALGVPAVDPHAATTSSGRMRLNVRFRIAISSLPADTHKGSDRPVSAAYWHVWTGELSTIRNQDDIDRVIGCIATTPHA
jgi:hypothetical protein